MVSFLTFLLGGFVGMFAMAMCAVSSDHSRNPYNELVEEIWDGVEKGLEDR